MVNNGNVVYKQDFENRRRHVEREKKTEEIKSRISPGYLSDIRGFVNYCKETNQAENATAFLDYLYVSVVEERVKKNTWEKRVVAIRKHFLVTYGITFDEDVREEIGWLRKLYEEDGREGLIREKGKSPVNKEHLLNIISELDIRANAICLVALITANRPNEMVRLQIKHFDLDAPMVSVYLRKQRKWHNKRLNQDTAQVVRSYIQEFKLQPEDYFIGRVNKSGVYESSPISETAYRKQLKKWTGYAPYNFRKTQVLSMHTAGADLSTIAKQTGHQSLQTLDKHYLEVSDLTVDKYL